MQLLEKEGREIKKYIDNVEKLYFGNEDEKEQIS